MTETRLAWAVKWRSENRLNGKTEYLMGHMYAGIPGLMLFRTREEARRYIREDYGYIRDRPDLRREPHGWKMPVAVKVSIEVKEIGATQ